MPSSSPYTYCGPPYVEAAVYGRLAACGAETKIHEHARLVRPERIRIGNGSIIDDFTLLAGGNGIEVGDRVHVATYSSILGGGEAVLESYAGLAAGCRIVTGSERYMGEGLTNPCVPAEFRAVERSAVVIRRHALLFTNVIVLPGVTIGEGCVVSAGSIVRHDLDPWGVYRSDGRRLRRVRDRPNQRILEMEQACIERYGY